MNLAELSRIEYQQIKACKNMSIAEILSLADAATAMSISNDIAIDEVQDFSEGTTIFIYKDGSKLKVEADFLSVFCG